MSTKASALTELIRSRRSPRAFLPTPLDAATITGVLQDAQSAPSNSNTQPWVVHVVSGAARETLSAELVAAHREGRRSLDFSFDYGEGVHVQRAQQQAAALYGLRGIGRSDHAGRERVMEENLWFYGAPHVALLFMPMLADGVRAAGDVVMYAQNFLLSLTARGCHGIPQAVISFYADTVRESLGVPADLKLLFGIAFGIADPASPLRSLDLDKLPVEHSVVFHDTPGVLA